MVGRGLQWMAPSPNNDNDDDDNDDDDDHKYVLLTSSVKLKGFGSRF